MASQSIVRHVVRFLVLSSVAAATWWLKKKMDAWCEPTTATKSKAVHDR